MGNETSSPLFKRRGVAQGSGMATFCFDLYTADSPRCLQYCTAHLYIDDCHLHISFQPDHMEEGIAGVNSDLNSIMRWSASNGLKLNISKCFVLHIAPQQIIQALSEGGVQVMWMVRP